MATRFHQANNKEYPAWVNSRWLAAGEAIAASLLVFGHDVLRLVPNPLPLLFVMAMISFRVRTGRWTGMGLGRPKSWGRTIVYAVAAAAAQQALGMFVVDPLLQPFLHYSAQANPLATHRTFAMLRWFAIIWTYAAFGEEIVYRGYVLNRVADIGNQSRTALVFGLLWASIVFGLAHWYQGPAGVVSAAVSGMVFGATYLLTAKNLWVTVLAHGLSDSLALLATAFGLAG
ncbi:MAG TPA: CPBP family intramembrane glutamic endopeptidase [Rhizomicrobium sp.]|nr:CPBP family intramembrane glutamic endopeptidase [Rhizomicrobium sp.]